MSIETKIASKLAKEIRKIYGSQSILNLHGHAMQAPGWPDWFVSTPNVCAWIETKGAATKLRLSQEIVLKHLDKCGQNAYVLRFLSDQVYMWETFDGQFILSCGGASWKEAASSVIRTLESIAVTSDAKRKTDTAGSEQHGTGTNT